MPSDGSLRVLRYIGIFMLSTAPITASIFWFQGQKTMALGLFGVKLYLGFFAVWGLPWFLRRFAKKRQALS